MDEAVKKQIEEMQKYLPVLEEYESLKRTAETDAWGVRILVSTINSEQKKLAKRKENILTRWTRKTRELEESLAIHEAELPEMKKKAEESAACLAEFLPKYNEIPLEDELKSSSAVRIVIDAIEMRLASDISEAKKIARERRGDRRTMGVIEYYPPQKAREDEERWKRENMYEIERIRKDIEEQ